MIVFGWLSPDFVTTYHTEPGVPGVVEKVARIKSAECYRQLADSVKANGILDPVVAMTTPTRPCLVEVGEERVLLARDLGIERLAAIIYTKGRGDIPFTYDRELFSIDEIEPLFKTENPPGLRLIRDYLSAGIMTLREKRDPHGKS